MMHRILAIGLFCLMGVAAHGLASADEQVDYYKQIKPILAAKCYSCHGALNQESELRLETRSLMLKGGDSGEVIVVGKADESLLMQRITADEEERMPPPGEGTALTSEEVVLLRTWINQGAQSPQEEIPNDPRDHWAFKKPIRAAVPKVKNADWASNPIDGFLAFQHEALGLVPVIKAEKHILLRRLYLDLIGLPPTRKQLQAFLEDNSEGAYEKVVSDLLDSPQYGERWGRHWMDIWRYSDWYGLGAEVRSSQRHIWQWRDWIVQSLNEDKPYNRMIVEMLAGDEIAPTDPNTLRATGFLARNWWVFNRDKQLDDTIEHTSKAFLGLTMNCTKCHDHKYDPISQLDYYRMRAFFEPIQPRLDPVPGEINIDKKGLPRVFDAYPDATTYLYLRGNSKDPDKSRLIEPGVPELLAFEELKITPISLPPEAYYPQLQAFVLEDHLRVVGSKIKTAQAEIEKARRQLAAIEKAPSDALAKEKSPAKKSPADKPPLTVNAAKSAVAVAKTTLAAAGLQAAALRTAHAADVAKFNSPPSQNLSQLVAKAALATRKYETAQAEEAVARGEQKLITADSKTKPATEKELATARANLKKTSKAIEQPGTKYTSLRISVRAANGYGEKVAGKTARQGPFAKTSTGRRTALAGWIASSKNPLTARVAVNHIWLRHFGQPLVEKVSDFGLRSKQPTQHVLLDWLAVELMENNWSMKHLHRRIVSSRAYQASSLLDDADELTQKNDPKNQYYWRRESQRLESQVIRDSLVYLAGELDQTIGGPNLDPSKADTLYRRSLYFTHSRDRRSAFLATFDDADVMQCYRRGESIIPQQALAMANSKLALSMSRRMTARLQKELGKVTDEQFIKAAFETILLVQPTSEETAACRETLEKTKALLVSSNHKLPLVRARENFVHALLNHNDFITNR